MIHGNSILLLVYVLSIQQLLCFNELSIGTDTFLGCFLDANGNRKTDIALFNNTNVRVFKQQNSKFVNYQTHAIQPTTVDNGKIVSIASLDFNYNGYTDLLVVIEKSPAAATATAATAAANASNAGGKFELQLWYQSQSQKGNFGKSATTDIQILPSALKSDQVLILDSNSDFLLDLFCKIEPTANANANANANGVVGEDDVGFYVLSSAESNKRYHWRSIGDNNIRLETAAFVDIDQDCRADLVYITRNRENNAVFEIQMRNGGTNRHLWNADAITIDIPLDPSKHLLTKLLFADINRDGAVDIIIPSIDDNIVYVYKQKHPNDNAKRLCDSKRKVSFSNAYEMRIPHADGYRLNTDLRHNMVIANFDMDLQIDLVLIMKQKTAPFQQKIFTVAFESNHLQSKSDKFHSNFEKYYTTAKSIAFFHSGIFPTGFHFAVQTESAVEFISYAELLNDKYFLSVCPLNGLHPDSKFYGATMPGVTVKAFFHNRKGTEIYLSGDTQWQSSTQQMIFNPFIVFGLSTVDSYIEKLVIGYSKSGDHFFAQPGVPPNSQLFLFPHPRDSPSQWKLETFLSPFITVQVLACIITVVMVILGAMWMYLEIKEKKIEKVQKSQASTTTKFFF